MIVSDKLGIRPVQHSDLPFLTDLANHPQVRGLVVGWDWPVALDGQADWHAKQLVHGGNVRLTIVDLDQDVPIGMTGLWDVDWHNQSAMTAVKLMPGAAPRGAGTDAIMLMNAWSFYDVGLRRLHGAILDFNGASFHAYVRKAGWRVEGLEKSSVTRKGAWHDLYRVAILRSDFDALPDAEKYIRYVCPIDVEEKINILALRRA